MRFLGFREDVAALLQGMDVFLMPSLYEGFPVTGVEGAGLGPALPLLGTITREVKILDAVAYLPLDASPERWAETIVELADGNDRQRACDILVEKGYDVHTMAKRLIEIYHARPACQRDRSCASR